MYMYQSHCESLGPQLKCVATLAGRFERQMADVMGFFIENIVNVAKQALDRKTSLQCVVRAGKFELI